MSSELDLSQYLDLFLQEADEQLEVLEQETLKLEQEPTKERLDAIFRAAHTLKGSSRAMGFSNFADITHEMENLLDELRAGRKVVTTPVADALLACLDVLKDLKDSISAGNGDGGDYKELIQTLKDLSAVGSGAKNEAPAAAPAPTAGLEPPTLPDDIHAALHDAAEQQPVFLTSFKLHPDCVMKFARAFMAINQILDGGELLHTVPSREDIEEERFEQVFHLYFSHERTLAEVRQRMSGIGEVDAYTVEPWTETTGVASATPSSEASAAAQSEAPETNAVEATADEAKPASEPAVATPTAAAGSGNGAKRTETGQTVRVDVARLDELMNLVGELVIDRTRLSQIGAGLAAVYPRDENIEALAETVGHINRITSDLQDQIMKARMLPIETVFNRFPRVVRDLAQKCGKQVNLDLSGGETELDRSVIEVIGDPLLHILRNCVDHGVETPEERVAAGKPATGTIKLSARHQENHIVIEISDDGKGIDTEKVKAKAVEKGTLTKDQADKMTEKEALNLIFASGLSTAAKISDISGRGVGMDIVRSNIQKLGGLIDLESTVGVGSRFMLKLPLTLAIIRGLLIKVSGVVYVVPLGSVIETMNIKHSEIQKVKGSEAVMIRGQTVPIVRLRKVFSTREFTPESDADHSYIVVVGLAEQRIALVVDSLVGEQEVVIKSLSRYCGDVSGISGATILGNGNVALIMDVNGAFEKKNR